MVVKPSDSDFFMFMLAFCTWILLMFLQVFSKTFPTEIETRKCPQQKQKSRQEKRRKQAEEKDTCKSRGNCVTFNPNQNLASFPFYLESWYVNENAKWGFILGLTRKKACQNFDYLILIIWLPFIL